ncbi:DUF5615 family PIN-like protein [Leptolyngbya sp. PCC 6406]
MKFLVDTQLPRRLAQLLQNAGYDTLHTRDLPDSKPPQTPEPTMKSRST